MDDPTIAEVRLDPGRAEGFRASAQLTGGFDRLGPHGARFAIAQDAQRDHACPTITQSPGNVG
jgi:hypothetical protein